MNGSAVNLAGVDLNLLVALEALLICQNVTHAARRVGQTQPAMSRALSRLRDLLDDDILVRGLAGMKLTARGEHLARTLPATMAHLRDVVSLRQVDNGFRVSIDANLAPALMPRIVQSTRFGQGMFKVNTHLSSREGLVQLRTRAADYVLGGAAEPGEDIERATVMVESYVTLVAPPRGSGPARDPDTGRQGDDAKAAAPATREAFFDLTHLNLTGPGGEAHPEVAQALIGQGLSRSRLLDVPDVTSAALMVCEGGMALTVPRSIAVWLTRTLNLSAFHPPFDIPGYEVVLSWLAGPADAARRHLIADIAGATRAAIAPDAAPLRLLPAAMARG
ncbi:LysR family transcriptional regulator [Breoghania sp. JC706]|uniref:LysR family transcriptional regulator n=1 Tax=Breoghania sp. JC706 TaxID=3117732 RepID=UPI003008DD1E